MPDVNRLEEFRDNGEILAINPLLLEKWENEPFTDLLDTQMIWDIVTNSDLYKAYNATPANQVSKELYRTPIDLLTAGPQPTLLHEVRT